MFLSVFRRRSVIVVVAALIVTGALFFLTSNPRPASSTAKNLITAPGAPKNSAGSVLKDGGAVRQVAAASLATASAATSLAPAGPRTPLWGELFEVGGTPLPMSPALSTSLGTNGETSGRTARLSAASIPALGSLRAGETVSLPLFDGEQATGRVNLVQAEAGNLIRVGGELTGRNGSFFLGANDDDLEGAILLPDDGVALLIKKAPDGIVNLTEKPIGQVLCTPMPKALGIADGTDTQVEVSAITIPILSSRPTATAVIYLDFDGETVTDARWNNGQTIVAAPANATAAEITQAWASIKEDYWMFNVDVTTDLNRYNNAPVSRRTRCIITPTDTAAPGSGGVSYINSFSRGGTTTFSATLPSWVFVSGAKPIAEAVAHEVGHTMGLLHDGRTGEEYYTGHGSGAVGWAPIMGVGYYRELVQWSKGEYPNASNTEDDLAIISSTTNGFGYVADEAGGTRGNAGVLGVSGANINQSGIISNSADVDYYRMTIGAGANLNLSANPAAVSPNLDLLVSIEDANGAVLATANPDTALTASIALFLNAGTYYVKVQGTGRGSVSVDGYSSYGSTGAYTLSGTIAGAAQPPTIGGIANQTLVAGTSSGAIGITVADADTNVNFLTLSATSSDQAVVPNYAIAIGGSGSARTITVVPAQAGTTTITVTVSDGALTSSTSFVVTATTAGTDTSFVTGAQLGLVRNDYTGWVGMQIVVGSTPLTVSQLGRIVAPGNTGNHTVKFVRASDAQDVPGGAVTISMIGGTPGQFKYGTLSSPVTLSAGTTYWIFSQEFAGGDSWYDRQTTLTTTNVATDNAVAWGEGPGRWNTVPFANQSYIPVDFKYAATTPPPDGVTSFVTGAQLGLARNDYTGWVGMQIVVGSAPLTVSQLGRIVAPGNVGNHTVKFVRASDAQDVPGGAVTISMIGGSPGQFKYGTLSSPVTLSAGTAYWILSQEFAGGDSWYDRQTTLTTTNVATDNAVAWGEGPGRWNTVPFANQSYVPVDFRYATTTTPPPDSATSFVTGAQLGLARNDYTGWVGMQIVVGSAPLTVSQLGRIVAPGNTGNHTVKFIRASDAQDVPGGAVTISMFGGTSGQFKYGTLSSPITLSAGTAYWILSEEFAGGDSWYDRQTTLTTTNVATDNAVAWGEGPGRWNTVPFANQSYVPIDFKYAATTTPPGATSFVTGAQLGLARNDYTGWVGMQIVVGSTPLTVSQLGRIMAPGSTGNHTVKFIRASDAQDVPGGAVTISMIGGTPGQFKYGTLSSPVTLSAGTAYWILSEEFAGGDSWYDRETTLTTTNVATDNAVAWGEGPGHWNTVPFVNRSYIPVDFKY